eukprot:UN26343
MKNRNFHFGCSKWSHETVLHYFLQRNDIEVCRYVIEKLDYNVQKPQVCPEFANFNNDNILSLVDRLAASRTNNTFGDQSNENDFRLNKPLIELLLDNGVEMTVNAIGLWLSWHKATVSPGDADTVLSQLCKKYKWDLTQNNCSFLTRLFSEECV